jgi:serine/threonine protein kinase
MKSDLSNFIKIKKKLRLSLGEVTDLNKIGEGGNALVYKGSLEGNEVALKFLVDSRNKKLTRFKSEYLNIKLIKSNDNIVKYITYDELDIGNNDLIPIILMKKYDMSLKDLRDEIEISEEELMKLFKFLMNTLELIHSQGIIHRDIKPENILIDNGNYVLSDFGIASYDEDKFKYKAETTKSERLGNYQFSAPEQGDKSAVPHESMDIYALGQLCNWFVFNKTHKGTGRKHIYEKLEESDEIHILDSIIEKSIRNDSHSRFQSIKEINQFIKSENEKLKKTDPHDEMLSFSNAIRKTMPEFYLTTGETSDVDVLRRLISNINDENFSNNSLWFTYGVGDNNIYKLDYIENNKILLNERELIVEKIWAYANDSLYDDLIIIEAKTNGIEKFKFNDDTTDYYAYLINDSYYEKERVVESGYIYQDGEPTSIDNFKYEFRVRENNVRYFILGTRWHCSILRKNAKEIEKFQNIIADKDNIYKLINSIRLNLHDDIYL